MRELRCPKCESESVRRSRRHGVFERLLSLVYVYPFRCDECERRFRQFRWREHWIPVFVDRRQFPRVPTDFWSTLESNGEERPVRVIDLSPAGAQVETEADVREGQLVQLKLDAGGDEPAIVVDEAVVRSIRPNRLGVQFVRIQQDQEGRLRKYLYQVSISRID